MRRKSNEAIVNLLISDRMKEARLALGLTQVQLAETIGVSYQTVCKHERGVHWISAARLGNIAAALGKPVAYFFDNPKEGNHA